MRWIIEGEWTGYTSKQQRVVHREVTTKKWFAESVDKGGSILYTDGTRLILTVREARPRERVKEINGYKSLIRDCADSDIWSVAGLYEKRKA